MKKMLKALLALLLMLTILINSVACDYELPSDDGDNGLGNVLDNIGDWWEDTSTNVGNWWESTSVVVGDWWGGTSEEMGAWWDAALAKGEDLYEAANQKFQEVASYLSSQAEELLDNIITNIATTTWENSQKGIVGSIVASNKTMAFVDDTSSDVALYDYDVGSFVYKLIQEMFPEEYEVFPAIVYNQSGEYIIGIAYTNFEKVYQVDDKKYYASGFMALDGEIPVTKEDLNGGTEIYRIDDGASESDSFFLAYLPSSFATHCVILGKYLVFGVDDQHQIAYDMVEYNEEDGVIAELGEVYSFDTNSILYSEYGPSDLTDSPFMAKVRYATRSIEDIKEDLYQEIKDFDLGFSQTNIKESFDIAKETVSKVFDEGGIVHSIKNMSINDLVGIDIFSKNASSESSDKEKMIVGTAMVMTVITTLVINGVIAKKSPQLASKLVPYTGAINGAAIEAFAEVVLNNTAVEDLNYAKIAIAAISGAISAKMDSLLGDAVIGGITDGVFAMIDGETFDEVIKSVYMGTIAGITLGVAFRGLSEIFGAIGNRFSRKLADEVSDSVVSSAKQININKKTAVLLETSDDASMKYIASKGARAALGDDEIAENIVSVYAKKAYKALPSPNNKSFKYIDEAGNYVDHKVFNGWIEITDEAPEALKRGLVTADGSVIKRIRVDNAKVRFDQYDFPKIDIESFSIYRTTNFNRADAKLANVWKENPDQVPSKFLKYFEENDIDLYSLKKEDVARMRETLQYTWHEDVNMSTIHLVPKALHNVNAGGISHIGGIGMAKIAKIFNEERASVLAYIGKYKITVVPVG